MTNRQIWCAFSWMFRYQSYIYLFYTLLYVSNERRCSQSHTKGFPMFRRGFPMAFVHDSWSSWTTQSWGIPRDHSGSKSLGHGHDMIWMRNGGFFPVPFETLGCDPFHRKSRDQFVYTNCLSYHLPTKKKVTSKSFYSMARKKPTFPFAVGISLCQDHCWLFDGDVARARCLTWAAEATPGPSGVGSRWGGSQPCFFLADGLMILGSFWTVCWGSHEFYR